MNKLIQRFEEKLFQLEKFICSMSLFIMMVMVSLSVVIRYFGLPLPNISEWALVAMSPVAFIGAAMCSKLKEHISVDLIHQIPSAVARKVSEIIVAAAMLAFSVIYGWLGWMLFYDAYSTGEKLLDMGTPIAIPIFCFFFGMILMSIHTFFELLRAFNVIPTPATQY